MLGGMARALVLVLAVGCGKGGRSTVAPVELAPPSVANEVATKLAAALTSCDRAAIDTLIDGAYIAKRATSDSDFIALVKKEVPACDELAVEVVTRVAPDAKPLLRWRHGDMTDCELRTFGYIELTVDKSGRIADLETPLHPQSAVTSLHNVHANLPSRDWPGMVSDVMTQPFTGLYTGASFTSQLEGVPPGPPGNARPENLDNVIEYGFRAHTFDAVQVAANRLANIVGEDPLLGSIRVAAAIGAKQGAYAVSLAEATTQKWRQDFDAWCVRLPAEMAGGTTESIAAAKQMLATQFKLDVK
jgi:hypothetical protein